MTETTRRLPRPAPGPMPPRWQARRHGPDLVGFEHERELTEVNVSSRSGTEVIDLFVICSAANAPVVARDVLELCTWIARGGSASVA